LRHVAKELTLLVLIIFTGGVCQKGAAPAQPVPTPRSRAAASSAVFPTLAGRDFYVAPTGSATGDGSFGSPWNLATALGQPSAVQPADTIWLRGGTYQGIYTSQLTGTAASPIIVRQYPGERATIDGGNSDGSGVLSIAGAYTWYWGFEIMSSYGHRVSTESSSWPTDIHFGDATQTDQTADHPGVKFINLLIHDTRQGTSFWKEAIDSEIYGCLIYHNGWDAPDRGHGHGIYTQNQTGTKTIKDNIIFANYSHGLHAYGSGTAHLDNFWVEGNTFFQNGDLSAESEGRNLLIGGGSVAQNPTVTSNYLYRLPGGPTSDFDLGYSAGCANPTVTNNYIAGNTEFVNCSNITMTGNTFYGAVAGFSLSSFPNNTYVSRHPTGVVVFVRPNLYEPGRANITVFNWARSAGVSVDLGELLDEGDEFVIRNAQDFFGRPVVSGRYSGGSVEIPMEGLTVVPPIGYPSPPSVAPDFGAFVVERLRPARSRPVRIPPSRSPATLTPRRP
jgi:hypothetical protein